jgi:hypothetical protein
MAEAHGPTMNGTSEGAEAPTSSAWAHKYRGVSRLPPFYRFFLDGPILLRILPFFDTLLCLLNTLDARLLPSLTKFF